MLEMQLLVGLEVKASTLRVVRCRSSSSPVMTCGVVSCRVMFCRVLLSCRDVPGHVSGNDVSCRCRVVSYHCMSCLTCHCHAMPCHAVPCRAVPCGAVPCHAMPCHAMPDIPSYASDQLPIANSTMRSDTLQGEPLSLAAMPASPGGPERLASSLEPPQGDSCPVHHVSQRSSSSSQPKVTDRVDPALGDLQHLCATRSAKLDQDGLIHVESDESEPEKDWSLSTCDL